MAHPPNTPQWSEFGPTPNLSAPSTQSVSLSQSQWLLLGGTVTDSTDLSFPLAATPVFPQSAPPSDPLMDTSVTPCRAPTCSSSHSALSYHSLPSLTPGPSAQRQASPSLSPIASFHGDRGNDVFDATIPYIPYALSLLTSHPLPMTPSVEDFISHAEQVFHVALPALLHPQDSLHWAQGAHDSILTIHNSIPSSFAPPPFCIHHDLIHTLYNLIRALDPENLFASLSLLHFSLHSPPTPNPIGLYCETYLRVNKHIYNTDELKINFVLSFMQTRTAGDWAINRESIASAYNVDSKGNKLTTIVGYGTWTDFVNDFKTTFITTNDTNEAQQALIRLKQTGTADDFNNQFQSLATRSGITSPEALIALYQTGLTPALMKSIYNRNTMPTTINAWYQVASCSDNIYRRLRAIQGPPPPTQQNNRFRKFSNNPRTNSCNTATTSNTNRPPRLTPEERDKCFKEGRCLACWEKGHNSCNCTKFPTSNTRTIRTTEQATEADSPAPASEISPPTPNDVALQIRQLINSLKDEEKEELFNTMDKQDF
ncbi:hypothetical protein M0805_000074 [Coniferiporia weirii]|nr:hypothetical protein M0805_000074 [Coniferiporia weirii]